MAIAAFFALSIAVTIGFIYVQRKAQRVANVDWESLVAAIQPVPFERLEKVALDHLDPRNLQLELDPGEMWEYVGGLEGLRRMRHNADLILQLAAHVRLWNFDESIVVAERIRYDALTLKRALFRIETRLWVARFNVRVPFYVHQAASSYYLMTRRVLTLYQANHYLLYPRLAETLTAA